MMWIAAMFLALALATPAVAEATDLEQLMLRPGTFVGKTVTINGVVFGAGRQTGAARFAAGRFGDSSITFTWMARDASWERAQLECADEPDERCRAKVYGVVRAWPNQPETFFIDRATVEFAAPE